MTGKDNEEVRLQKSEIIKLIDDERNNVSNQSRLFKEWFLGAAIFLAIAFVFFLGKLDPLDAIKDDHLIKGIVGTSAALGLSFFWYVVIVQMNKENKEKEHARLELDNFSRGLKILLDFQQEGEDILSALNKAETITRSLIVTKDEISNEVFKTYDANNLTIMASLVGLYQFLPEILFENFKKKQTSFETDLIGSNVRSSSRFVDFLWLYPLGITISTINKFLTDSTGAFNKTMVFNLYYLPYDILEAFILFGNHKLLKLPTLQPDETDLINNRRLIGQVVDKDKHSAHFARYLAGIDHIQKKLKDENRFETWSITFNNNKIYSLRIDGFPHWIYSTSTLEIIKDDRYEKDLKAKKGKETTLLLNQEDEINQFLKMFTRSLSDNGLPCSYS